MKYWKLPIIRMIINLKNECLQLFCTYSIWILLNRVTSTTVLSMVGIAGFSPARKRLTWNLPWKDLKEPWGRERQSVVMKQFPNKVITYIVCLIDRMWMYGMNRLVTSGIFDKSIFTKTVSLVALRVPSQLCQEVR